MSHIQEPIYIYTQKDRPLLAEKRFDTDDQFVWVEIFYVSAVQVSLKASNRNPHSGVCFGKICGLKKPGKREKKFNLTLSYLQSQAQLKQSTLKHNMYR